MDICVGRWPKEHDEIVYDSKNCPLCKALDTIEDLEKQINELSNT